MVEVDSVVYEYAREYFGLAATDIVHLTDARWVHAQSCTSDMFLVNLKQISIKHDYCTSSMTVSPV